MAPPRKYFTDEDRALAVREQRHKYQHKKHYCKSCVCAVLICNIGKHLKTAKHLLCNEIQELKTEKIQSLQPNLC